MAPKVILLIDLKSLPQRYMKAKIDSGADATRPRSQLCLG